MALEIGLQHRKRRNNALIEDQDGKRRTAHENGAENVYMQVMCNSLAIVEQLGSCQTEKNNFWKLRKIVKREKG